MYKLKAILIYHATVYEIFSKVWFVYMHDCFAPHQTIDNFWIIVQMFYCNLAVFRTLFKPIESQRTISSGFMHSARPPLTLAFNDIINPLLSSLKSLDLRNTQNRQWDLLNFLKIFLVEKIKILINGWSKANGFDELSHISVGKLDSFSKLQIWFNSNFQIKIYLDLITF